MAGAKPYAAKFAASPKTIASMPVHQSGSLRYEYPPLPARRPVEPARRRPFFLMMKLAPMNREELTARKSPVRFCTATVKCKTSSHTKMTAQKSTHAVHDGPSNTEQLPYRRKYAVLEESCTGCDTELCTETPFSLSLSLKSSSRAKATPPGAVESLRGRKTTLDETYIVLHDHVSH